MEVLPSGLTVLLRELHVSPVAEVQIWARVGSADERPDEHGLAHFHEHMLFKGTERRGVGEVAGAIEGAGGRINAYTTFDTTVYHATLPERRARRPAVDVLSDAVQHSLFDPDEVGREVGGRARGDPALGGLPAPRARPTPSSRRRSGPIPTAPPILGRAENVACFDSRAGARDSSSAGTRRRISPWCSRGTSEATPRSSSWRARSRMCGAAAHAATGLPSRPRTVYGRRCLRRPFERTCLELCWPVVPFAHPDAPLLDLLGFILGEGESSRLVQRVKERERLGDRLDASCWTPLDAGLFGVSADLETAQLLPLVRAVAREVETLRLEPVTELELSRARANFLAVESWERESVSGIARKLGSFHVVAGDCALEARYLDAIRRATPADLLRVADAWLPEGHATLAAVLPEDEEPKLEAAALADAAAEGAAAARRRSARPRASAPGAGVESYALENGAVVHVVPRRDVPVVALRAALLGGQLAETPATAGLGSFLASMWLRGTRSRSAADFARRDRRPRGRRRRLLRPKQRGRHPRGDERPLARGARACWPTCCSSRRSCPRRSSASARETLAALERREDRSAPGSSTSSPQAHWQRIPTGSRSPAPARRWPRSTATRSSRTTRASSTRAGSSSRVVGDVDPDEAAGADLAPARRPRGAAGERFARAGRGGGARGGRGSPSSTRTAPRRTS